MARFLVHARAAVSDFIFYRDDSSPLDPVTAGRWLFKTMKGAGIKCEKGRHSFHIFRHSAGSLLYFEGS